MAAFGSTVPSSVQVDGATPCVVHMLDNAATTVLVRTDDTVGEILASVLARLPVPEELRACFGLFASEDGSTLAYGLDAEALVLASSAVCAKLVLAVQLMVPPLMDSTHHVVVRLVFAQLAHHLCVGTYERTNLSLDCAQAVAALHVYAKYGWLKETVRTAAFLRPRLFELIPLHLLRKNSKDLDGVADGIWVHYHNAADSRLPSESEEEEEEEGSKDKQEGNGEKNTVRLQPEVSPPTRPTRIEAMQRAVDMARTHEMLAPLFLGGNAILLGASRLTNEQGVGGMRSCTLSIDHIGLRFLDKTGFTALHFAYEDIRRWGCDKAEEAGHGDAGERGLDLLVFDTAVDGVRWAAEAGRRGREFVALIQRYAIWRDQALGKAAEEAEENDNEIRAGGGAGGSMQRWRERRFSQTARAQYGLHGEYAAGLVQALFRGWRQRCLFDAWVQGRVAAGPKKTQ